MLYLDIVSGIGGAALYSVIKSGINNFKLTSVPLIPVIAVLIARVVTNFLYDKFGNNPDSFGGSNMEFILSSVVWFALIFISMPDLSYTDIIILYSSTFLVMMATARLTHWG